MSETQVPTSKELYYKMIVTRQFLTSRNLGASSNFPLPHPT